LAARQAFRSNRQVATDASLYRFSAPFIVRLLGVGLAVAGLVLLLLVVAVTALGAPAWLLLAGALAVLLLLVGVGWLRSATVVSLDAGGYRVRLVRGAGVRQATWRDVEDVAATTVAGERCVVLRLRDGRSTTIPAAALGGSPDGFVRDLQRHLDRGHGYRPLPPTRPTTG
jgi:hypothetical protein